MRQHVGTIYRAMLAMLVLLGAAMTAPARAQELGEDLTGRSGLPPARAASPSASGGAGGAQGGSEFVAAHGRFFRLYFPERTDGRLSYRYEPTQEEDGGPGEFSLHAFSGAFEIPRPMSTDSFMRYGAEYELRRYDFESAGVGTLALGSESLHKVELTIGAGYFLNDDLLFTGALRPGLYSDFNGGVSDDWFALYGDGQMVYRINPGAQLVLGAAYTEDFSEARLLPLIGFRLLSGDGRLHLSLTAPLEFRAGYLLSTDFEIYGGAWISGDEYRVEVEGAEFDIQIQENRLGAGMLYWLGNHVALGAEAGILIGSELDVQIGGAGQFEGDLKPGPYLAAQLGFAL